MSAGELPLQPARDLAEFMERTRVAGAFRNIYAYLSANCAHMAQSMRTGSGPARQYTGSGVRPLSALIQPIQTVWCLCSAHADTLLRFDVERLCHSMGSG